MTAKRFTVDGDGKYWDRKSNKYVTIDHLFYLVEELEKENEQLRKENQTLIQGIQDTAKQGAETITKVWESKNQPNIIKRGYYD